MTQPVNGANPGNPESQQPPVTPPAGTSNPPVVNSNDGKFVEVEKHETLKRQYSASTEEALRLKKDNEKLVQQLEESNKSRNSRTKVDTDDAFKALVDEKGTVGAIAHVIQEQLNPLATKVEKLFEDKTESILNSFKAKHPGLEKVKDAFNTELNRLRSVYSDVNEAMEAAYRIVGGTDADRGISDDQKAKDERDALAKKSEDDKNKLTGQFSSGNDDRRTPPANPITNLEQQIKILEDKALLASMQGKTGTELDLRAKVESLKSEIAKQRS